VTSALKEAARLADFGTIKLKVVHHRLEAVAHLAVRARVFGQPSEDAVSVGIRHVKDSVSLSG
jgi:O-acetyl-ADP-ribose deacetylase (regulator of RNase III)